MLCTTSNLCVHVTDLPTGRGGGSTSDERLPDDKDWDKGRFLDTRPVMLRNVMLAAREAG